MSITHHCSLCGDQVEEFCAAHPAAQIDSVIDSDAAAGFAELISWGADEFGLIEIACRWEGKPWVVYCARNEANPSHWEPVGPSLDAWLPKGMPKSIGLEVIALAEKQWGGK